MKRVLEDLRVASWSEFVSDCHSVSLFRNSEGMVISPSRTDPTIAAFISLDVNKDQSLSRSASSEQVGETIIAAFQYCATEASIPEEDTETGHF